MSSLLDRKEPVEMPERDGDLTPAQRAEVVGALRKNWSEEMHSAGLYRRLAMTEPEGDTRTLLLEMSEQEVRHAEAWGERLRALGGKPPGVWPGLHELFLPLLARAAGIASVVGFIEGGEAAGKLNYLRQAKSLPDAASRRIAEALVPEERTHHDLAGRLGYTDERRLEHSSRAYFANFVRDAIFGLNDGLVSNFSLIAGVAGANAPNGFVILAGIAGLCAGAISMAIGSYISNKSQMEVVQGEINRKREEIEIAPDEERDELRRIFRVKGYSDEEVEILVRGISADEKRWLEVMVSESLGLSITKGAPPVADAAFTGAGFAIGAVVPIIPFFVAGGFGSLVAAACISAVFLFAVGAAKTVFTNRNALRSGLEMTIFGVGAAVVTHFIGRLLGATIS